MRDKEDALAKKEQVVLLYDMYGDLLTDKQKKYISLYYEEDLSLGEIASEMQVSRNAVYESLKNSVRTMVKYEDTLHLLEKYNERMALIDRISEEADKTYPDIDEYLEMLRRL